MAAAPRIARTLPATALAAVATWAVAGACGPAPGEQRAVARGGPESPPFAFAAERHPDTVDFEGPYRVTLRQLAGPTVRGGRARYRAESRAGEIEEGAVALRPTPSGWSAELPGQSPGSEVSYRFELRTADGAVGGHPARDPRGYRFRVVDLRLVRVEAAGPPERTPDRVSLHVEGRRAPSGELVFRTGDEGGRTTPEQRVSLEVHRTSASSYRLDGELPRLGPGQAMDVYFEVSAGNGTLRVPADAPRVAFSWKRPSSEVERLPIVGAPVLDLAATADERWVAFQGAGVEARGRRAGVPPGALGGLPSGVVRAVDPDATAGRLYLATDRGVASREGGGSPPVWLTPVPRRLWRQELAELAVLQGERRAGPAALSSVTGTLLVQLQGAHTLELEHPPAVFLEIRGSEVAVWTPPPGPGGLRLVGLSAAAFDSVDGCWLLGGVAKGERGDSVPVLVRRCGETLEWVALSPFRDEGRVPSARRRPERVVAVARAPSGDPVVGLELRAGSARRRWGAFRVDVGSGELRSLASGLDELEREVTALATHWGREAVLVATLGDGVVEVAEGPEGGPRALDGAPEEATALAVAPTGEILVGTPDGSVIEIGADEAAEPPTPPAGGLPPDALPMDVAPRTGRVLLSSRARGLFELDSDGGSEWRLVRASRAGPSPESRFGDAVYTGPGSAAALVAPEGVLLWNDGIEMLGEAAGLPSRRLARILWRDAGELWVATPPTVSRQKATIHVLRGGSVARRLEIEGGDTGTISDWVSVPERSSVFAATRAGVVEITADGSFRRLSAYGASAIARDAVTGAVGAAGTAVSRWSGERFEPVLFGLRGPRLGSFTAGSPIDLAIDPRGFWYLLFQGGVLARLRPGEEALEVLDPEDGIPTTALALLAHPETGVLFVGSAQEGVVVVRPEITADGSPRRETERAGGESAPRPVPTRPGGS